jgi:hypothetical protein
MAVNEPKKWMRGQHQSSSSPFGYVGLESRGPAKHPLRPGVTPHVAQNTYDTGRARQTSAIDGRTTRHPGYAASQRSANGSRKCSVGQGQCGAPKDQVPEPGQSAIAVHPRLLLASISSEYPSCSRRPMICIFRAVITPDGDLWRACWRAMEPLLVAKREKRL